MAQTGSEQTVTYRVRRPPYLSYHREQTAQVAQLHHNRQLHTPCKTRWNDVPLASYSTTLLLLACCWC